MSRDMTSKEKLLFILSFVWTMHWGTKVVFILMDMVFLGNSARVFPIGF